MPQIESLEAWAAKLLKPGMWWLRCAPLLMSGTSSEGVFWVLLVDSEAFPVPVDLVHSAAQYEEGWLVVRSRWFELEQRSPRGYKLKPAPRLVVVNTMIRLPNVIFSGGAVGKPTRALRSGLHVLFGGGYGEFAQ